LSISTVAFFALCGETIFGAAFPYKVFGIHKQNLSTSVALLKVFFKAHILNDERMELSGLIDSWNDFLAEDCADVVRSVGFAVFFVDDVGNVLVLLLVDFQVKNFLVSFR
jgi:hypothetical protein